MEFLYSLFLFKIKFDQEKRKVLYPYKLYKKLTNLVLRKLKSLQMHVVLNRITDLMTDL